MTLLVAGDIGGTKTTLRLVKLDREQGSLETLFETTYASREFPDLVPIVQNFLNTTQQPTPKVGCFAIAGPVIDNSCQLTNLSWSLDSQRLESELGMVKVSLINDFAANSYGILHLEDDRLYVLQDAPAKPNAPIAVLGAGTGLGESFLIPSGENYQVFATEGGHADFAPRSARQFRLLEYLQSLYQVEHISVERVVSGRGIVAIYRFLRDRESVAESAEIAAAIRKWEQQGAEGETKVEPAAVIAKAALEKTDDLCQQTMAIFLDIYGSEAGNLALKLLPYGGLYIAGGIARKILPLLAEGTFMKAFRQKGRMDDILAKIPVRVILHPQVGLLGSVMYAIRQ